MPLSVTLNQKEVLKQLRTWFVWAQRQDLRPQFSEALQPICSVSEGIRAPHAGITLMDITNPDSSKEATFPSPTITIPFRKQSKDNKRQLSKDTLTLLLNGFKSLRERSDWDEDVFANLCNIFSYRYHIQYPLSSSSVLPALVLPVPPSASLPPPPAPPFFAVSVSSKLPTGKVTAPKSSPRLSVNQRKISNALQRKRASRPKSSLETVDPRILPKPQKELPFEEIFHAIKQLRNGSDCGHDCMLLTESMLHYLATGIVPQPLSTHTVPRSEVNIEGFVESTIVKVEPPIDAAPQTILTTTRIATERRGFYAELPYRQSPFLVEDKGEFKSFIRVDKEKAPDKPVPYHTFNTWALAQAQELGGTAFGSVILSRQRLDINAARNDHILSWLAVNNGKYTYVMFFEPQYWNGKTQTHRGKEPIFFNMIDGYDFFSPSKSIHKDTFESTVHAVVHGTPHFIVTPPPAMAAASCSSRTIAPAREALAYKALTANSGGQSAFLSRPPFSRPPLPALPKPLFTFPNLSLN